MLNEVESSLTIWDVFWTLFGHYNTVLIWQDILWYLLDYIVYHFLFFKFQNFMNQELKIKC